ncbi:hypothetical protein L7F22_051599 [Adiantum nelumboides]|nr:hypothetical protein [Adiantum nelumboides]
MEIGGPSHVEGHLLDLPLPPSNLPPTWLPLDFFLSGTWRFPEESLRPGPLEIAVMLIQNTKRKVQFQDLEELCEQSEVAWGDWFGYRTSLVDVRSLPFDMDMADLPSQCRRVRRCPNCCTKHLEPLETDIYQCFICLTLLKAKAAQSNYPKKALQCPSNEVKESTTSQREGSSIIDTEQQEQALSLDERKEDLPKDEGIRNQEQSETESAGKEAGSQTECYPTTSVTNLNRCNSPSRDSSGRNVTSASIEGELAGEGKVSGDHSMQEDSLEDKAGIHLSLQGEAPGDGFISESVTLEITEIKDDKERVTLGMNCSMPSTCAGKFVSSGESARVEETYQEEGNHSNGKSNQKLELELMKDNDCELSNVLSGERVGGEETYQEEGNPSNGKSNQEFESEITRDNDCELSFKYIAASSLKSNVHLGEKKRIHRLAKLSPEASGEGDEVTATPGLSIELPPTNQESSDDYESDSSLSESPSHHGSDAEFDFPAPSAESMHSIQLSEMLLKPRTPEGPHQLEWQDVDYNYALSTFQKSKGSAVSSTGFVGGIASNVAMAQMEFGAKGERDEGELHIKNDLSKITVSRLDITAATGSISLHGQRETAVGKIEGLAKLKENVASESYNKVPVSGAISGECVDKDSLVGLLNEQKLNMYGESKDKLLGSSRTVAEQSLQWKPLGIVRAHMQSSGADASSSTFLGDRKRKPCLTVKEGELIESNANVVLKESTSSLQDNVLGTLHSIEKRERQAPGSIVIAGGDAEYARYDLRKVSASGVVRLPPNGFSQTNMSQSGLKSEGHYHQDYFGKEVQFQKRVEVDKMSYPNSKEQHKKSYSSDAVQLLNGKDVASSSATYQHEGNIDNEAAYISAARTLEGSLRAHEGNTHAAPMLAGPSHQLQRSEDDLYMFGQPIHKVDAPNAFPASSQSFGSNLYFDGSRYYSQAVCSYQAPSHPLLLPIAMPGHVYSCHGCHPGGPVCMPYVHGKHSLVPQLPIQSCLICLRTLGHYQGHTELGNNHQGFQVQAPCMLGHSPTFFSPQIPHMHETLTTAAKPLKSSVAKKPKHYPPLPQGRMVPYVACTGCNDILEVPVRLPVSGQAQKLRCSSCGKVSKFTVLKNVEKSYSVGLQSSAVGSTRQALSSSPPSFEFMVRNNEPPISAAGQSTESSHGKSLHSQNQWGSTSSRYYTGSGHHSLQGEPTFKVKPSQDEPNAKLSTGITGHTSEDDFFFRSLSRKSEFDSSRSLFRGFKTMSARFGIKNVYSDSMIASDDVPLEGAVDEKEEGLDFGAPRPSDGESLDQRSPESRMRSPENFELVHRPRHRSSFGNEKAFTASEIQEDFGSERNIFVKEQSSTSLYTLLNQESTKFEINLEERVPYEDSSWSPGSKSPAHGRTSQSSNSRAKEIRNLRAPHFVKKGQRYIASMLTRSLKHHVNV